MKFAYAKRMSLGDGSFTNVTEVSVKITEACVCSKEHHPDIVSAIIR